MVFLGGQFKSEMGGQFESAQGGQFDRILHPTQSTYRDMSVIQLDNLPEVPFDISILQSTNYYSEYEKPVFFGHYWLNGKPELLRGNICCLDYSVAKNGVLAAYRFDGEKELSNDKFTFV
ncbi:MAG: hypothetical protein Q8S01_03855 [Ignavibacteria bacterium]|nr:hypothetical protein [Ignavibacteria bacterium]